MLFFLLLMDFGADGLTILFRVNFAHVINSSVNRIKLKTIDSEVLIYFIVYIVHNS